MTISEKFKFFVHSSWNLVKIIASWANYFHQVSWRKDKKCGFFNMSPFFDTDFRFIQNLQTKKWKIYIFYPFLIKLVKMSPFFDTDFRLRERVLKDVFRLNCLVPKNTLIWNIKVVGLNWKSHVIIKIEVSKMAEILRGKS